MWPSGAGWEATLGALAWESGDLASGWSGSGSAANSPPAHIHVPPSLGISSLFVFKSTGSFGLSLGPVPSSGMLGGFCLLCPMARSPIWANGTFFWAATKPADPSDAEEGGGVRGELLAEANATSEAQGLQARLLVTFLR